MKNTFSLCLWRCTLAMGLIACHKNNNPPATTTPPADTVPSGFALPDPSTYSIGSNQVGNFSISFTISYAKSF